MGGIKKDSVSRHPRRGSLEKYGRTLPSLYLIDKLAVKNVSKAVAYHNLKQEPIIRSMRLHYISVTAFSYTGLYLKRISLE